MTERELRYGMGIGLSDTDGRRTIVHGGGINGFLSESEYYPDDDLVIVVLLNTAGPVGPRELARQIAEAVLGKAPDRSRPFQGDVDAVRRTLYRARARPAEQCPYRRKRARPHVHEYGGHRNSRGDTQVLRQRHIRLQGHPGDLREGKRQGLKTAAGHGRRLQHPVTLGAGARKVDTLL